MLHRAASNPRLPEASFQLLLHGGGKSIVSKVRRVASEHGPCLFDPILLNPSAGRVEWLRRPSCFIVSKHKRSPRCCCSVGFGACFGTSQKYFANEHVCVCVCQKSRKSYGVFKKCTIAHSHTMTPEHDVAPSSTRTLSTTLTQNTTSHLTSVLIWISLETVGMLFRVAVDVLC